jgi:hypothetical protein
MSGGSSCAGNLPIVSIGAVLHGRRALGDVFDNRSRVILALEHLHNRGHRRIGVLTPTRPSTPNRPAYVRVSAELAWTARSSAAPLALTIATELGSEVLSRADRPTAVVSFADYRLRHLRGLPPARPAHRGRGLRLRRSPDVGAADAHAHYGGLGYRRKSPRWGPDHPRGHLSKRHTAAAPSSRRRLLQGGSVGPPAASA